MTAQMILPQAPPNLISARQIQQRFLEHCRHALEGLDYAARCRPLHAVGGDFYDFLPLAHNRLGFAIGDASGKGLPAAVMISNVQSSLRTAVSFAGHNTAAVIAVVNRQLYESSAAERYATLFYGVVETATRTLRYVNAGHNPPMLLRRDSSIVWLETGGAPVGMFSDWKYVEGAIQLHPGDVIVAFTDGIVEATNWNDEEWGVENLRKSIVQCSPRTPENLIDTVFEQADEFARGARGDDASVLAMRVD